MQIPSHFLLQESDGGYDDEYFSDEESRPQSKRRKTDGEVGII